MVIVQFFKKYMKILVLIWEYAGHKIFIVWLRLYCYENLVRKLFLKQRKLGVSPEKKKEENANKQDIKVFVCLNNCFLFALSLL